ncbi:MAG: hypothetical protein NTZ35_19790 [Ignavibacteriales bacterium]|nr:hypothetical protein [Ignavibacteriales bacterium]
MGEVKTSMVGRAFLLLIVMAGSVSDHSMAQTSLTTESRFEQRRQRLIDVVSQERDRGFFTVAAKLSAGRDKDFALAMLDSLTTDESIGGMFYAYSAIGTYLRLWNQLPDSLVRKLRQAYRERTMYRGDTENHWVAYYTGLYLAAQTWPNEDRSQWFNGKSSMENFKESEEWLNRWMSTTATIGQGEFDSPTYFIVFMTPMLTLFDFAKDPVMKRKAQMTADLLFADFAAEHLNGNYCGGHSRDYPDDIVNPLSAPAALWAWLYFGEPNMELWQESRYRPRYRGGWETVFGAMSSYRLPDVIHTMATDRSKAYVHTETKRTRNVIRFGQEKNPPVYKYTYMTHDYALGSLQGGILQPIQQHTWDVTYRSDKPNNTIFTLHPFYSGRELAMFFPEEQKFLADEVDRYHLVYTDPNKWNSSSPYEQTFQHKNAIIVLYSIDKNANHQHIDGFFPKNLDERIEHSSGWIFCRAGSVYVAFFPLRPYQWIEEKVDWRWRSTALKNGIVLEVGSSDEDGTFEAFRNHVMQSKPAMNSSGNDLIVNYETRRGDVMKFTFDGKRRLNGKAIDFKTYKFFNGPFIQSERGSGIIRMTDGKKVRELNFKKATIKEWQRSQN